MYCSIPGAVGWKARTTGIQAEEKSKLGIASYRINF